MAKKILECVPNFSEGRDLTIILKIKKSIESTKGVKLLHVDSGYATNRTVISFAGEPGAVIEAAYQAVKCASENIDMRKQKGVHPRIGATDVIPLVPISGISMVEIVKLSHELAMRIGEELNIPVFCYEKSALKPERIRLENIRQGEYEGLPQKLIDPNWKPDFGPAKFNAKSGATNVGARNFLVALNINLNTKSVEIAKKIASEVRESGKKNFDEKADVKRIPGILPTVKAIGWYIENYGLAQVSMNLTDINKVPMHIAFETVKNLASNYRVKVTGSELIGLVPLNVLLEAGKFYSQQNNESKLTQLQLINSAIDKMGLSELKPFIPNERIIEYLLEP